MDLLLTIWHVTILLCLWTREKNSSVFIFIYNKMPGLSTKMKNVNLFCDSESEKPTKKDTLKGE